MEKSQLPFHLHDISNNVFLNESQLKKDRKDNGAIRERSVAMQADIGTFLAFRLDLPLPRNSTFFSSRSLSLPRSIIVYANRHTAAG